MRFETESEPKLFKYGILNEASDIRAHVSVTNKAIYVFETCNGIAAIGNKTESDLVLAYQQGVDGATASGWPILIEEIEGIRRVDISHHEFTKKKKWDLNPSEKGAMAVVHVVRSLKEGIFPLWIASEENNDAAIQIAGTDVVLAFKKRIQVKCDWACGEKPKGTGNVYLQFKERNPNKHK